MINVLNAGNNKVFDGLLLTTLSMVKHTKCPINMICFTMDLTELDHRYKPITKECADYINNVIKSVNKQSNFKLIDLTKEFKKELIHSVNIGSHFIFPDFLCLFVPQQDSPLAYKSFTVQRNVEGLVDIIHWLSSFAS